jgi:hypothetical protein
MCSAETMFGLLRPAPHAAVQIPYGDDGEGARPCKVFSAQSLQ